MGEISPPTGADYAMSAARDARDENAQLRKALGVLVLLLSANGTITEKQGAQIAAMINTRS